MRMSGTVLVKKGRNLIQNFVKLRMAEIFIEASRHGAKNEVKIKFGIESMDRHFTKVLPCPPFQAVPSHSCTDLAANGAAKPQAAKLIFAIC